LKTQSKIRLYTIGFTKKSAEKFFTALTREHITRIIDIRLNNVSQLAGFAKKEDLKFFLKTICNIEYLHIPDLAPTEKILGEYKKQGENWEVYEKKFIELMSQRKIEDKMREIISDGNCLLCSEDKPDQCHRRLAAEYLNEKWGNLEIRHIV
jgi:uncharacterized protein (DUF488 family)